MCSSCPSLKASSQDRCYRYIFDFDEPPQQKHHAPRPSAACSHSFHVGVGLLRTVAVTSLTINHDKSYLQVCFNTDDYFIVIA